MKQEVKYVLLGLFFVGVDRGLKLFVSRHAPLHLASGVSIELTVNSGGPFNIMENSAGFWLLGSLLLIAYVFYTYRRQKTQSLQIPLLFMLYGGLSNMFDRIFYKYVVDVISIKDMLFFNVADFMLLIGFAAFAFKVVISRQQNVRK